MMNSPVWQPSAAIETIKQRAAIIGAIRQFFFERDVLEVETPLLARHSVTDPHMSAVTADNPLADAAPAECSLVEHSLVEHSIVKHSIVKQARFYLQTSPEYMMKRLLAAGSGPIYQIGKAFRKGECSRRHNPEFSLLEWYRPGFDHVRLMEEVEALVVSVLGCTTGFEKLTYRQAFQRHLSIDPHVVSCDELTRIAHANMDIQMHSDNKDDWLNILLAQFIEPNLGVDRPTFIYDYPASQAALAKVASDKEGTLVAQRFELYVNGTELANGYFELTDVAEQRRRFQQDQSMRELLGRSAIETDHYLLAAMASGLPSCAGVALGVDRLVMLALGASAIDEVLTFSVDRV